MYPIYRKLGEIELKVYKPRVWWLGGTLSSGYSDKIETIPIASMTPYDSGADTPATCRAGGSAAFSLGIYHAEGYTTAYSNDVHRVDFATLTVHENAAQYEDATGYAGYCATELKFWICGGANSSAYYDDVNCLSISTDTFVNIEVGLSAARDRGATVATPQEVLCVGGKISTGAASAIFNLWTHSVETYATTTSLPSAKPSPSGHQSDMKFYVADDSTNYAWPLSTKTWQTLDSSPISQIDNQGSGSFAHGFLKPGGEVSSNPTADIMEFSFATETTFDSGADLTEAKMNTGYCSG